MTEKQVTNVARATGVGLRRGLKPRSANPQTVVAGYRKFNADRDGLLRVGKVMPASLRGTDVSTDGVTDGWHLLVIATTIRGEEIGILVCRRGWMPVGQVDEREGEDRNGRTVKFSYSTTGTPPRVAGLCLSHKDRDRVVAGILGEFMDPPNWDLINASRRRPF